MYTNSCTMYATTKIEGIMGQPYVYNFCYTVSLFVIVILGFVQV